MRKNRCNLPISFETHIKERRVPSSAEMMGNLRYFRRRYIKQLKDDYTYGNPNLNLSILKDAKDINELTPNRIDMVCSNHMFPNKVIAELDKLGVEYDINSFIENKYINKKFILTYAHSDNFDIRISCICRPELFTSSVIYSIGLSKLIDEYDCNVIDFVCVDDNFIINNISLYKLSNIFRIIEIIEGKDEIYNMFFRCVKRKNTHLSENFISIFKNIRSSLNWFNIRGYKSKVQLDNFINVVVASLNIGLGISIDDVKKLLVDHLYSNNKEADITKEYIENVIDDILNIFFKYKEV